MKPLIVLCITCFISATAFAGGFDLIERSPSKLIEDAAAPALDRRAADDAGDAFAATSTTVRAAAEGCQACRRAGYDADGKKLPTCDDCVCNSKCSCLAGECGDAKCCPLPSGKGKAPASCGPGGCGQGSCGRGGCAAGGGRQLLRPAKQSACGPRGCSSGACGRGRAFAPLRSLFRRR